MHAGWWMPLWCSWTLKPWCMQGRPLSTPFISLSFLLPSLIYNWLLPLYQLHLLAVNNEWDTEWRRFFFSAGFDTRLAIYSVSKLTGNRPGQHPPLRLQVWTKKKKTISSSEDQEKSQRHVVLTWWWHGEAAEVVKQLCGCIEINPMTRGECLSCIKAASHPVSIFTHTHRCTCYTPYLTHTHTACQLTRTGANCSLLQWAALLMCMPCDAHSAQLLTQLTLNQDY